MFLQRVAIYFFILQCILLCDYTSLYLYILLLLAIWVVSPTPSLFLSFCPISNCGPMNIFCTFLLGRKVMTNLDSILKSRDITLLTNVCLVKAMVFPVVMYGCESWTIRIHCRMKKINCNSLQKHNGLKKNSKSCHRNY